MAYNSTEDLQRITVPGLAISGSKDIQVDPADLQRMAQQERTKKVNWTDEDAQLMKGRKGIITGYNAQTMASPLNPEKAKEKGMLITSIEVVNSASDYGQLGPMPLKTEDLTGQRVPITLADGGYNTVASLEAGLRRGQTLVMAQRNHHGEQNPYFKDNFIFDSQTDIYICPPKKRLLFRGIVRAKLHGSGPFRIYRASRTDCRTCLAFGTCTKDKHSGRALWISFFDELLRKHRQWMETDEARILYARRKEISEPTFGILRDQMNARRFLLRGLVNVRAEFNLLATAFNLRTLWRI